MFPPPCVESVVLALDVFLSTHAFAATLSGFPFVCCRIKESSSFALTQKLIASSTKFARVIVVEFHGTFSRVGETFARTDKAAGHTRKVSCGQTFRSRRERYLRQAAWRCLARPRSRTIETFLSACHSVRPLLVPLRHPRVPQTTSCSLPP